EHATRASRLCRLYSRSWFRAEDRVPHLPALAAAVWSGCSVRLRYREGRGVVQRTIDPLGLVLKGGAWYVVARRSAGMRVYRVSRVAAVRALPDTFERPPEFELATFWDEWSRAFEEGRPRVEVRVRVAEERKSTRLNSSHRTISYAVFCLKKKKKKKKKARRNKRKQNNNIEERSRLCNIIINT